MDIKPKLTDKQKKKIISDYVSNNNYSETGRMNNVSHMTVKNIVLAVKEETLIKFKEKEKENMKSTLEYMEEQHKVKKDLVKNILKAMNDKSLKPDMFTNIRDLATAYGIIIDKELKVFELSLRKQEIELKEKEINSPSKVIIINDDLPTENVETIEEVTDEELDKS